MAKIDTIDKQIVDLLIDNGRMSCAEIAKSIGSISERSVRYRLDRLIDQGIIRISAIALPQPLGFPVVADVFIEVEPGALYDVVYKIAEFEQVSYVACSTGMSDISVQVYARDNVELHTFVVEVLGKIHGVRRTTTSIVPVVIKDVYRWRIPFSICTPADTGGDSQEKQISLQ